MSHYDYDDYTEPSEAELIINEAEQKLKELVKPDVQKEIKALQEKISHLIKANTDLKNDNFSLESKLNKLEKEHATEIEDLKKNMSQIINKTLTKSYWEVSGSHVDLAPTYINTEDNNILIEIKRSKRYYSVNKMPIKYIDRIIIKDNMDLVIKWNDRYDFYDTMELKIHDSFDIDKIINNYETKNCFSNKRDAQQYADYLNENEKGNISESKSIKELKDNEPF